MIESPSPVPPWMQIAAILREQIASGELAPGALLPSLPAMSQLYGVNRSTVQKATRALKDEGLIVTSNMGTFVARE